MIKYKDWVKNLPKGLILPRARYDSRNLIKDINININVSGFNMSSFVPTAPIRQSGRENVFDRAERESTSNIQELRQVTERHEQMLQEARERSRQRGYQVYSGSYQQNREQLLERARQRARGGIDDGDEETKGGEFNYDDIEVESRRSPIFSVGSSSTSSTISTGSSAPSSQVLDEDEMRDLYPDITIPNIDPDNDVFTIFSQTRREEIDTQYR
tara:strand:+ start:3629 stop:4270 length:642 start_codon:yes stop_codon:yes gene_type:complete